MVDLSGFRVAVLATDGFEESELTEPVKALTEAGHQVTMVSLKPGKIKVFGTTPRAPKVNVDRTIGEVDPRQFDAVQLPGEALNADTLRVVPEVQSFLQAMQEAGKPIAAICHAPWPADFRRLGPRADLDQLPHHSR